MNATLEKPKTIQELFSNYKRAPTITNSNKSWPVKVKCRFIEPGLVDYKDLGLGMILVQRPFLNKVMKSFEGKPVIDQIHKDAKPENFNEIADGMVSRVWTDPVDGWDWCEFYVWDEETLKHTKDPEYYVSCAYDPTKINRNPGKYHNIPYDGEFLDGEYTHLAIVKDPRYEGAKIVWNSLGAKTMNLFKIFKKSDEVAEVDGSQTFLEVDGEQISVANAVKIVQAENKKAKNLGMKDDDVIEIDGKNWSGKDIKNAIANAKKKEMKNKKEGEEGEEADDQDEEVEKEKKEGEKRDKAKNSLGLIAGLKLPKEQLATVINSLASSEDFKDSPAAQEVIKEALNAVGVKAEDKDYIKEFKETMEMRNNQPGVPTVNTMEDRLKAGMEAYGKVKQTSTLEVK